MSTPGILNPYPADLNIWQAPPGFDGRPPDPEFARLTGALRLLQDRFTAAQPPPEAAAQAADLLEMAAALLEPFAVAERDQVAGRRLDLPGRGQTLVPPFYVEVWDDVSVRGQVTFTRFYLGGNGAAHGGVLPLFFDEVLGRLANVAGRPRSRTAYLHVDYRQITPIGKELKVAARFDREEGRKRFLSGEVTNDASVVAEAHALFVMLRPGQP
jgi:acyl-coenzyme A thioesterase PaaI-like protein